MILLGLALSGWYLGSRIASADAAPVTSNTAVAGPIAPPVPAEDLIPLPPEPYLQLPALGTAEDMDYVVKLHARGYPAFVEIGQGNPVGCILIGPFAGPEERKRIERRLAATGALAVETTR